MNVIPEWLLYLGSGGGAVYSIYRTVKLFSSMISKDQNQQKDIDDMKADNKDIKSRITQLESNEKLRNQDIDNLKGGQQNLSEEVKKLSNDHVKMDKILVRIDSKLESIENSVETLKRR